jgi:AcrR family transcriptional regulator
MWRMAPLIKASAMTTRTRAGTAARKPRADAMRNRQKLLAAAKASFGEVGPEASLDEIARRAGVGIGTLYRHFPTREAIIEAVYRHEVEQLATAADRLLEDLPPGEALRQWLRLFVDYLAAKKVIAAALGPAGGGTTALYASSGDIIRGAVGKLIARAKASGDVRADIEPPDLMQAQAGLAYNYGNPGWKRSALRLVDIIVAGLRPEAARKPSGGQKRGL